MVISAALFGMRVLGCPATAHVGFEQDPSQYIWCMAWWPYALIHRVNPFITSAVWAPVGYNLTWAASIPAVALAFSPITLLFGPVVSYNCAALLAPALSAWAAFLLCRYVILRHDSACTTSASHAGGAFFGGLIYGFSPYEAGHIFGGHLNLTFVLVPPLCVMLVLMLVRGEVRQRKFMVCFAALLVMQCLISTEVLASMTLVGAVTLLAAIVLFESYRGQILTAALEIGLAYMLAAFALIPFLYFALVNNAIPREPAFRPWLLSADVLSFIVPPLNRLIHTGASAALAVRFSGNQWENAYVGVPILAITAWYIWRHRRQQPARMLGLIFCVVTFLELGPVLQVAGRCSIRLPWTLIESMPLIGNAMPLRLANYGFLIAGLILALFLSEPGVRFSRPIILAVLLSLFPNPRQLLLKSVYEESPFFAQRMYRKYLPRGDNVLIIPFGIDGPSMAWQAESSMYFRMSEGYLGLTPREFLRWPIVNLLLTSIPVPRASEQLAAFIAAQKINAIIVSDRAQGLASTLPAALGIVPEHVGGVFLYRRPLGFGFGDAAVRGSVSTRHTAGETSPAAEQGVIDHLGKALPTVISSHSAAPASASGAFSSQAGPEAQREAINSFGQAAAQEWFSMLVCAANRFISSGHPRAALSAPNAWKLGLLPDSKWDGNSIDVVIGRFLHGGGNGLWLGPGPNGTLSAGMMVPPAVAQHLYAEYKGKGVTFFYPNPSRGPAPPASQMDDSVRFLLFDVPPPDAARLAEIQNRSAVDKCPRGLLIKRSLQPLPCASCNRAGVGIEDLRTVAGSRRN